MALVGLVATILLGGLFVLRRPVVTDCVTRSIKPASNAPGDPTNVLDDIVLKDSVVSASMMLLDHHGYTRDGTLKPDGTIRFERNELEGSRFVLSSDAELGSFEYNSPSYVGSRRYVGGDWTEQEFRYVAMLDCRRTREPIRSARELAQAVVRRATIP